MMNEMTKIVWSGLTGRTGCEAISLANDMEDVEIVAGVRREIIGGIDYEGVFDFNERTDYWGDWYRYRDLNNITKPQPESFDVLVDFSHPDVFEQIVELAVRTHVPLISGTSGLSNRQMAMLYDATNQIPVFRGGNFRFKVKKFIDECVEIAKHEDGTLFTRANASPEIDLREIAETSNVIQRRIRKATGRSVCHMSQDYYPEGDEVINWELHVQKSTESVIGASCCVVGYDELAHDVLEIAKVMKNKPIKNGEFYDLDEIWDEIPAEAK